MWEPDGLRQGQTAILTHNFFSWPYHAVLSLRPHLVLLLLLGRRYPTGGQGPQRGALNDCKLALTFTDSDWQAGICIYYYITSTTSDRSRDCLRLFTQVCPVQRNLWLMARSRVNMQHLVMTPSPLLYFINLTQEKCVILLIQLTWSQFIKLFA